MSTLQSALSLAKKGFHVFPLAAGSKLPAIDDFPNRATRDPKQIKKWWTDPVMGIEQPFNVGISTTRYGDDEALLVIDVDNKGKKKGDEEILRLEMEGKDLPGTLEQRTPTGGRHIFYKVRTAVKQGVNVLAPGIDVRSKGGYVVGAGSHVDAGDYKLSEGISGQVCDAPEWLCSACPPDSKGTREHVDSGTHGIINTAHDRAIYYLENEAPHSIEGEAGDQTAFIVAARLKDFGVDTVLKCTGLMLDHWNDFCSPPWDADELLKKVHNAYSYGQEPVGVDAPEMQFEPILPEPPEATEKKLHPVLELNKEFAFVLAGGGSHILWETIDERGLPKLEHLDIQTFHNKLAARIFVAQDKTQPLSKLWMKSPDRRSYDGICFMPGKPAPDRFYNLWRGFAVEPLAKGEVPTTEANESLEMFLEHAMVNVCHGDRELYNWLIGYFAHLVQQPWERPNVALVFKGKKGTGKNALIERVGHLVGNHFLLTADRRYLVGNFNSHLENLLLFTLDEAFWSGDKQAEGIVKNLITGATHLVEHKGKESYKVANCTRVVVIGNEEWLIPATEDERRYAVFNVGDGRKQDRAFFKSMREGMERGGYRVLLRFLLDYDISDIDVTNAPSTEGLLDQKIASLEPFHQWWFSCLTEGCIVNSEFSDGWHRQVDKDSFRNAFRRYHKDRNIRSRIPDERVLGKLLKACLEKVVANDQKRRDGETLIPVYRFPPLDQARKKWEDFIGHKVNWENETH